MKNISISESSTKNIAKPHTIKKFELIEEYAKTWARKILQSTAEGVVFIDCMSNSGIYYDENNKCIEGTAIRIARLFSKLKEEYPSKKSFAFFNDFNQSLINILESKLDELNLLNGSVFTSGKDANIFLKDFNLSKYKNYNILLLYDPYVADIDWSALHPFLSDCWGEVILNHMVSDTLRGISQASKKETVMRYEHTYQKQIDKLIKVHKDIPTLEKTIIDIMKENNNSSCFISSFPFFNRTNGRVYSLIHYTKNPVGFTTFKSTAWKVFNGKSSMKNTHGYENQLTFNFEENQTQFYKDEDCYNVNNIADYLYKKYNGYGEIKKTTVWNDLNYHPIFPCKDFKIQICNELKNYNVEIKKSSIIFR